MTPYETRFSAWSNGRIGHIETTSTWPKSLSRYIPRLCVVCGREPGKETLWSQTLKSWRRWTHQNFTPEGSMKRKCKRQWKVKIHIPSRRWNSQSFWGDQDRRTSTLIRDIPDRGEEQNNLRGESEGSSSTPRQDSSWYESEAKDDFLVSVRRFYSPSSRGPTVRADWRIIPDSTEIRWRYQNYRHVVGCDVGEKYWRLLQCYGDRELSDTWSGFTRFTISSEKPPDGCTWCGERLTRKQTTSMPDIFWLEMWQHKSDASKLQEKQKWPTEKPSLDNARRLRDIYFIDSEDEEFKFTMTNARRKLEIPLPAAMLCKTSSCRSSRETCSTIGEHKTNTIVLLKLTNLWESGWKEFLTEIMKITLQTKAWIHQVTKSCAQIFRCLKKWKIPDARAEMEKEWEKLEKIPAWNLTKVNKMEVIAEAMTKGTTVHFASSMDLRHHKNSELEPQFQEYKGRVVLRGILWKMIQALPQYFLNMDDQLHKWRLQKLWILLRDYQDAQDKQQTQYPLIPGQNGRCSDVTENSKVRMSRYLDTFTET